ncbi:MAG: TetR/AcrR family transcriptional regulator [Acidimicrobiia bacterium]
MLGCSRLGGVEGSSSRSTRRYRSPLRERRAVETKAALVRAATESFIAHGWAATGMRDVARAAGVAVETLYSHYPSKRALLDAVVDHAAAGDDAPLAVAERSEFQAMGRGRRADRVAAAAAVVAAINARTAPFARLIREAAVGDQEIAGVLAATRERQRADVAAGVGLILGRPPTDAERDGVWALVSPEVFLLLVHETGWSVGAYEQWLAETLARVLPRR